MKRHRSDESDIINPPAAKRIWTNAVELASKTARYLWNAFTNSPPQLNVDEWAVVLDHLGLVHTCRLRRVSKHFDAAARQSLASKRKWNLRDIGAMLDADRTGDGMRFLARQSKNLEHIVVSFDPDRTPESAKLMEYMERFLSYPWTYKMTIEFGDGVGIGAAMDMVARWPWQFRDMFCCIPHSELVPSKFERRADHFTELTIANCSNPNNTEGHQIGDTPLPPNVKMLRILSDIRLDTVLTAVPFLPCYTQITNLQLINGTMLLNDDAVFKAMPNLAWLHLDRVTIKTPPDVTVAILPAIPRIEMIVFNHVDMDMIDMNYTSIDAWNCPLLDTLRIKCNNYGGQPCRITPMAVMKFVNKHPNIRTLQIEERAMDRQFQNVDEWRDLARLTGSIKWTDQQWMAFGINALPCMLLRFNQRFDARVVLDAVLWFLDNVYRKNEKFRAHPTIAVLDVFALTTAGRYNEALEAYRYAIDVVGLSSWKQLRQWTYSLDGRTLEACRVECYFGLGRLSEAYDVFDSLPGRMSIVRIPVPLEANVEELFLKVMTKRRTPVTGRKIYYTTVRRPGNLNLTEYYWDSMPGELSEYATRGAYVRE